MNKERNARRGLLYVTVILVATCFNQAYSQIQDSILLDAQITSEIITYEETDGLHLILATKDKKLHHITFDANGVSDHKMDEFTPSEIAIQFRDLKRKKSDPVVDESLILQDVSIKGSGLGGYFAPFTFISETKEGDEKIKLPLEEADNLKWENKLTQTLSADGKMLAAAVLGKGIKKDKTRKKNQFYEFEFYLYSADDGQILNCPIRTEWATVPHHVGVIYNDKGLLDSYYVEFALGGGSDGVSKLNKGAPKNARYIAVVSKEGELLNTYELQLPIKINAFLMKDEFYVDNVLRLNNKIVAYMKTFDSSFKPEVWLPDYFEYRESDNGDLEYTKNIDFKNYRIDETDRYTGNTEYLEKITDLSEVIELDNGSLFSYGTTDNVNFKYMITDSEGQCKTYGEIGTLLNNVANKRNTHSVSSYNNDYFVLTTLAFSADGKPVNDHIFIQKETGEVLTVRPEQATMKDYRFSGKQYVGGFGSGVANPRALHFAVAARPEANN